MLASVVVTLYVFVPKDEGELTGLCSIPCGESTGEILTEPGVPSVDVAR